MKTFESDSFQERSDQGSASPPANRGAAAGAINALVFWIPTAAKLGRSGFGFATGILPGLRSRCDECRVSNRAAGAGFRRWSRLEVRTDRAASVDRRAFVMAGATGRINGHALAIDAVRAVPAAGAGSFSIATAALVIAHNVACADGIAIDTPAIDAHIGEPAAVFTTHLFGLATLVVVRLARLGDGDAHVAACRGARAANRPWGLSAGLTDFIELALSLLAGLALAAFGAVRGGGADIVQALLAGSAGIAALEHGAAFRSDVAAFALAGRLGDAAADALCSAAAAGHGSVQKPHS